MLPVVHLSAGLRVAEGKGAPAQKGTLLDEGDMVAEVEERTGRGEAGESPAQDNYLLGWRIV